MAISDSEGGGRISRSGADPEPPAEALFLSLVIPAHNEQRRLPATLEAIAGYLAGRAYQAEVLVVENGSTDATLEVAEDFARRWARLRVLHEERAGKGLAVRRGMLEARGQFRFLCDADLSMPIDQLDRFLPPALNDFDLAIGTRESPRSQVTEPPWRRIVGRAFNALVRTLVLPGFRDTQCGFKCFRAEAAEFLFRRQRLEGLTFDVEVLFVARRRGLRIVEVPITWRHDADSRVRLVRDGLAMACDLLAIRRNARRGRYE